MAPAQVFGEVIYCLWKFGPGFIFWLGVTWKKAEGW